MASRHVRPLSLALVGSLLAAVMAVFAPAAPADAGPKGGKGRGTGTAPEPDTSPVEAAPADVCTPASGPGFDDVRDAHAHAAGVACARFFGIVHGTSGWSYAPGKTILREQMASLLARTLDVVGDAPVTTRVTFTDTRSSVHADAISRVAARGIAHGTTSNTFGPREAVRRGQMAAFTVRTVELLTGRELAAGPGFPDTAGHPQESAISKAAAAGIVRGVDGSRFDPDGRLTRAQAATMVARVLRLLDEAGKVAVPVLPPLPTGGRWSDPATWSSTPWAGGTPPAGATVTIPAGRTVILDTSTPQLRALRVDGRLVFDRREVSLAAESIVVAGTLQAGTAAVPHRHPARITVTPRAGDVAGGFGPGAVAVPPGGRLDLHGAPVTSWTRLVASAPSGASGITVAHAHGWKPGDRIVIAPSGTDPADAERRTITSVNGTTLGLDRALSRTHVGNVETIAGRQIDQRAEVGLLSRNVAVTSPERGFGGHVIVRNGATARLANVELGGLGQSGALGRYPLHFHHVSDASSSYLRSSSVHGSANRCLSIHATHRLTVADNVLFDAAGHCLFLEDGVETGNRIHRNLALLTGIPEASDRLLASDATPASFWISNPANSVVGNVAAGSHGSGFWYDLQEKVTATGTPPGQLHHGHPVTARPATAPLGAFVANVAHSNRSPTGVQRHGSGLFVERYQPALPAVFERFTAYANAGFGIWLEDGNVTAVDAVLAGNGTGFLGKDAALRRSVVVGRTGNPEVRMSSMTGVAVYHDRFLVDDVTFANFAPDRATPNQVAIGGATDVTVVPGRFTRVRFVDAERVRIIPPWHDRPHVPSVVFHDTDGSITGAPAIVTGRNPLLGAPGCREWGADAWACPLPGLTTSLLHVHAPGDPDPFGPVTLTRGDGASHPAFNDAYWSQTPEFKSAVANGHRYAVTLERQTPTRVEITSTDRRSGWVEIGVPWPHAQLFVYHGWYEWAYRAGSVSSPAELAARRFHRDAAGRVWVRFPTSTDGQVSDRFYLCAKERCGTDVGSRRS